jgi:hypothetical protein
MAKSKTKKEQRPDEGTLSKDFEVTSGKVRVTDPCYDTDTWCSAEVADIKNGNWKAWAVKSDEGDWGVRCAELRVWHSDHSMNEVFGDITRKVKGDRVHETISGGMRQEQINADIGVDSGQAGVFDSKFFKDDKSIEGVERTGREPICVDEPWYSMCCDRTLGDEQWGTIPYGAVSSSGYGDGSYTAYKAYNKEGQVVGIRIVFI